VNPSVVPAAHLRDKSRAQASWTTSNNAAANLSLQFTTKLPAPFTTSGPGHVMPQCPGTHKKRCVQRR